MAGHAHSGGGASPLEQDSGGFPSRRHDPTAATLLTLFLTALTVKIAIAFGATEPTPFLKYPFFAQRLAEGIDIGERLLDLSPLYLYVVTLYFKVLGPNWESLALFQAVLGSLTCLVVYRIGQQLWGAQAGLLAALLMILYGNTTLIELTLEPEALVLFLQSLAVWLMLRAAEEGVKGFPNRRWLAAGGVIGLAAITKANGLLMLPLALAWAGLALHERRPRLRAIALLMLGAILVVAPVSLRNYFLFDDIVLITADGGKVFYHGNGPGATGMERADLPDQGFREEGQAEPDYAHVLFRERARAESGERLKPSACSAFWRDRALAHLAADPVAAWDLLRRKFLLFWNPYEIHDLDTSYRGYVALQQAPLLGLGLISALGIIGMGMTLGDWRRIVPLYGMVCLSLATVMIFFPASRYRLPVVPYLCLFAAYGVTAWIRIIRERSVLRAGITLLLLPLLLVCSSRAQSEEIRRFDRWQKASRVDYREGRVALQQGRLGDARHLFEQVLAVDPDFAPAYNALGKVYVLKGDRERAERCFVRVTVLAPGVPEGYENLARLFERMGDSEKAGAWRERARALKR